MRKIFPYAMALIAISLMFLGVSCSKDSRTSSNRSQNGMSDSDVEKSIENRIKADPQLSAFDIKVNADSNNNEVKLSGTVNSEDARKKAVQLAQSALPGFAVSDTIDVKPRELARSEDTNGTGNQGNTNQNQNNKNDQRDWNRNQSDQGGNYNRDLNQNRNQNQQPMPAR
jgi:hypothetical protein